MYPAIGLVNGNYTYEDLPDELYAPFLNLTYTRVTPYDDGPQTVYYEAPPQSGEPQRIVIEDGEWNSGSLASASGPCLVTDLLIEDTFEDTYTVQILSGDFAGTYMVIRRSLCVWSDTLDGEEPSGVSIIAGSLSNGTMLLEVRDSGGAYFKNGNLNSPVGNYGIPTTRAIVS
jgi:hypothetical protein